MSSNYCAYLSKYYNRMIIRKIYNESTKNNRALLIKREYETIIKQSDKFAKDFFLTKFSVSTLNGGDYNYFDNYKNSIIKSIDYGYYKNLILSKYNEVFLSDFKLQENESLSLHENVNSNDILKHLIENNKGNAIYVDVWGTWCWWCLQNMKVADEIHHKYKNTNIKFVYLCARSPKNYWKKTIAEKQLKGEHYFISDKQYESLLKSLGTTERKFPTYILIDKNGSIVDRDTEWPSKDMGRSINPKLISLLNSHI